jgi:hypothetical protein
MAANTLGIIVVVAQGSRTVNKNKLTPEKFVEATPLIVTELTCTVYIPTKVVLGLGPAE